MIINLMDKLPENNGQYLVGLREPMHGVTHFGPLPYRKYWKVCDYVVAPRYVGESHKVPYWDTDHPEFIVCWGTLPDVP